MPDGTVIRNVPEGTTKAQLASKLGMLNEPKGNTTAGMVGKVGQGLSMGLADEMQAGLFALPRYIGNKIRGQEDASLGGAYDQLLNEQRANLKAAEQEYPIGSAALEIAGGVAPALAGYGAAGKLGLTTAQTALGRRGREALIGGVGSGIYGFNTGEGEDRLSNAGMSAATGAILSPALGAGLEKAGKVLSPLYQKVASKITEKGTLDAKSNAIAAQLQEAIYKGDKETVDTLIAQITAARLTGLPYNVPLSKGNITQTLAAQDIEEKALKGALGQEPQRLMTEFTTKQNQALRSNISSLIRDNNLPANAVGDDIVEAVASAYKGAKGAKTAAYTTAKPLMDNAWIFKNSLTKFGKEMDEVLMDYPQDVAKKIRKEFNSEIARSGKTTNIPFSRIEAFRKRLNNLGAFGTPENAAGGAVKSRLDAFLDSGQITGDRGAVEAITRARQLNSQLKRTYQTKQASPLVREIVGAVDNNTQLAPEKLFQAISTGSAKQNANNVKSLIDILGQESPVVSGLRDSMLKDIRDRATDASGFVSPQKLAGNIEKLIYANRTVANSLLTPNEVKMLKSIQDVSRKIAYKAPGVVNNSNTGNLILRQLDALSRTFVGRNVPLFSNLVNSLKESSAANTVSKSVAPMLEAQPVFGGVGELPKRFAPVITATPRKGAK